jgi:diguanylate cyclase (GGDEF)-like protein
MADRRGRNGSAPQRDAEPAPAATNGARTLAELMPREITRHAAPSRPATAAHRDAPAAARDRAAELRDEVAERRDREFAARDAAWSGADRAATGAQILLRAAETRRHAADDRAASAEARARAAVDRAYAAADRAEAARDRLQSQVDRETLRRRVAVTEIDALTGARTRRAGLADLDHEIARARRTSMPLTLAYVDVVGLKAVNDTRGHAAGDALLQQAVRGIRAQLRSYDVIVRVGGDEFVCVLSGATPTDAAQRFAAVRTGLATAAEPCEVRIGLAALRPGETGAELIERADAELPGQRSR